MWTVLLLALVGTTCISAQRESQCQCGGFLTRPGYSEWFYSFLQFFEEDCLNLEGCKNDCYNYLFNLTNGGDLTTIIQPENKSVGDLICQQLNRNIPTDTTVVFEYQVCNSEWHDTGLNTTYPFCCVDLQYPEETGCPII